MAEEENNQVSPQSNNNDHENTTESPNDNSIEQVINQGIYGLTGLDDAVSKPDEEPTANQKSQSINPNENNASDNNTSDSNNNDNNISQIQNQTDSNSEGISANAVDDENDINNQNQNQGELESLTNQLSSLSNEVQKNEAENDEDEEDDEEEEEEEEEAEDAEDQADQNLPTSEVQESADKIEHNDNDTNPDDLIQNDLTKLSDELNQNNENKLESNVNEPSELANLQTDIGKSLLPDQITNDNENNDSHSKENKESIENNKEDKEINNNEDDKSKDENNENSATVNEENNNDANNNNDGNEGNNDTDKNDGANEENNNDDKNNEDEDNSTDGMMVQDEFKDSYTNWKDSSTPKIPGSSSITHLPPLETTPELDEMSKRMLERFESKGKLPDPEYYAQVLQYMQRQKVNSVVSNDFVSAGRYQNLSQRFMTAINSTHVNENQKKKLDLLEEKLEITNSKLRNFQSETEQLIKNERYRLTDKRAQLVNIHQETLNNFEEHWNDEDFLIKYARPSSNLLQTKKIERSFVLVKDFEGAENCRKKVAELEKIESQQAQRRARSEMEKQYKKLTTKQDAEIDAFDDYARSQLELMSKDRSSQYETLIARQSKLQSQITELKHPGRQSWTSASGPLTLHSGSQGTSLGTSLPSLSSGKSSKSESLMTPRTIQRYALFKTTVKQPKLTVKPLGAINQRRKQVQAPKF